MTRIFSALCWVMACIFPVSLVAADSNAAMLTAAGAVKVNGSVVPSSYTVFAGDQIATGTNASVSLLTKGASIGLPADSAITYGGRQVEITYGGVVIDATAASGMKARIGNLSATPAGAKARFQMTSANGKLALAALDGALTVTDGVHTATLRAGQMLTSAQDGQGGGSGTGNTASSKHFPGWVLGVLVGGMMITMATVAATTSGSPSPSKP